MISFAGLSARVAAAWLAVAGVLIAGLYPHFVAPSGGLKIGAWFLYRQDLPVLWAIAGVSVAGLAASLAVARVAPASGPGEPHRFPARRLPFILPLAIAAACCAIAWAGTFVVYDGYALSMDEYMANFDARILAHGQLMAPIAPAWRPFLDGLQPTFVTVAPDGTAWSSQYLPVNAALRALGLLAGAPSLVSPLLTGVSILALFGVARQLWPARPDLGLVAIFLLASASQFLVTAMTAYSMTAHLAFNLVWLWLFLRRGKLGHLGALVVGFLACGLHQFLFHPLFAAPFILQLFLQRRWRLGLLYVVAYGAFCGFWIGYGQIAFALAGAGPGPRRAGAAAAADLTARVKPLLATFGVKGLLQMDDNFIRFVTWQSLLAVPLAVLGAAWAVRAGGVMRSLLIGLALTAGAMFVIIPYQGHGWGYRYWHGLMGSVCLLAAFAWGRLTDRMSGPGRRIAGQAFACAAAVSLVVVFPLRAWQAHAFEHPYARAWAAIANAPGQVVLVDPAGAWFASDLVRNDPYLRGRPLVFDARALDEDQVGQLCARYRVTTFGAADAKRLGVRASAPADSSDLAPPPPARGRPCHP